MAKLPRAPDRERLAALEPALHELGPGTPLYRIYRRGGTYPVTWRQFRYFGPLSRFDHQTEGADGLPRRQDRGVLYAAGDVLTATAETFQHDYRRINRARGQPWLAAFELARPLALLDLTDTYVVRAGASMKLVSGPFSFSQAWARGFYESYDAIAGLRYNSSLTNRPVIALFERADTSGSLSDAPLLNRALDDPILHATLKSVADEIGYKLL